MERLKIDCPYFEEDHLKVFMSADCERVDIGLGISSEHLFHISNDGDMESCEEVFFFLDKSGVMKLADKLIELSELMEGG